MQEKVKCMLCGVEKQRISRHLKVHSVTVEEYKMMFPNAQLTSEKLRDSISKGTLRSLEDLGIRERRVAQLLSVAKNSPYKCGWIHTIDKDIYYRSSYELEGLLFSDLKKVEIASFESETFKVPYKDANNVLRLTVPDWKIILNAGSKYVVEIKPTTILDLHKTILKIKAAAKWAKDNGFKYCIWTEEVIFRLSSTTMSLEEILEATVAHQNGERYSLDFLAIERIGEKSPSRLFLQESIKGINNVSPTPPNYCLCNCGEITAPGSKYKRGHNRRGCLLSEEHKLHIGKSGEGHVCKKETREKLSIKHTGKVLSPEHCIKISEALTGKTRDREAVDKMIATNLRKYASGERVSTKGKHYKQKKNRLEKVTV